MKQFYYQYHKDWDDDVRLILFIARESVQDFLGFSPFGLVRAPLKVIKEKWLSKTTKSNLLDYISKFKERLSSAFKIAQENFKASQNKMKSRYDVNTKIRNFKPGEKVLVFLPIILYRQNIVVLI